MPVKSGVIRIRIVAVVSPGPMISNDLMPYRFSSILPAVSKEGKPGELLTLDNFSVTSLNGGEY